MSSARTPARCPARSSRRGSANHCAWPACPACPSWHSTLRPGASRGTSSTCAGERAGRALRIGQHHHIVGGLQHGGEHLAPGDAVAAVHRAAPARSSRARRSATWCPARRNCRRSACPAAPPDRRCAAWHRALTSGLCSTGMTTEACMLNASAVDGQPWPKRLVSDACDRESWHPRRPIAARR